ncbi:MAG TPA: hypothetical protein VGN14_11890 [Candidatus Elarobacter sp.]
MALQRLVAAVALTAFTSTAAAASTTKPSAAHAHKKTVAAANAHKKPVAVAKKGPAKCKVAPADEYFGKLKMSILGIRNTIKDQGLKVDNAPEKAESTLGSIALTEDAIHDWQHKYPCDSWLPGSIYALAHFYTKIHTADGVKHVHATYAWLHHDYPRSSFIAVAKREDAEAGLPPPQPPVAEATTPPVPGAVPQPSSSPSTSSNL